MRRWTSPLIIGLALAGLFARFNLGVYEDLPAIAAIAIGMSTIAYILNRRVSTLNPAYVLFVVGCAAALLICAFWMITYIPPAFVVVGTLILALILAWNRWTRGERLRARRELAGQCITCGYDLRASEERCPECGNEINNELIRRRRIADELRATRRAAQSGSDPVHSEP